MIEYEYSIKVTSIKPYLDYCEKEGYKKISDSKQVRELFENDKNILARITTKRQSDKEEIVLDFKDADDSDKTLKTSRETIPLEIKNNDRKAIESILEILDFKKRKELHRKRIVYTKNKVKFEIDEYTEPEVMNVVAIEGEKEEADRIYKIVSEQINNKLK